MKVGIGSYHEPHCIVWVKAVVSLFGIADDHDLDEPVRLTEVVPVRLRYVDNGVVIDRDLTLKTVRAGRNAAMRFYFKSGKFYEIELRGINVISPSDKTVEVNRS